MSERNSQLLELYRQFRVEDQLKFYRERGEEFDRASGQALAVSAVLFGLGSAVAAVAGLDAGWKQGWAALAAIVPAVSAALVAYSALFAFDQQSKVYGDAMRVMRSIVSEVPDPAAIGDSQQLTAAVATYVEKVEEVLRKEQAQWGQLTSQIQLPDSPKE